MLQKMYSEKIEEVRGDRTQGEYADGVRSKKLDFLFYQRALKKNKWLIFLVTALVTAVAIYYAQIAPPVYAGSSTLLLESQKANIVSIEDLVSSEQESSDYYGTQIAILRSRALAERVIRRLGRGDNFSRNQLTEMLTPTSVQELFLGRQSDGSESGRDGSQTGAGSDLAEANLESNLSELISHFRKSLSIKPVAKTKLVTIVFESTDPEFAALAANAVAKEYIESVLERRKALENEVSEWMDGRLAEIKTKLDASEEALLFFKKSNGLIELAGSVDRLNEQELLITINELGAARSELSKANDLFRKTQNLKSSSPQFLGTLPFVQNDALVRSASIEVGQAERDLSELKNRYGFKHPRIVDAESRLGSLRATLNSHIGRVIAAFENDYQLLQQRVASLENSIVQSKENIQAVGQQKIILESLEREVAANRDQYNGLFNRITETQTSEGLNEANAVIAESAWVPIRPVKPNKIIIIGLALVCSLLLCAAVAFIVEYLDDTVNSADDIEKRLKTKLLGFVPLLKGGAVGRDDELPLSPTKIGESSDHFIEAVNTCRTRLSIGDDSNSQIILVTSTVPNEGKSTVALNLAYSFGQLESTLLIDCDLRKPSIEKALEIPQFSAGLSSLLLKTSNGGKFLKRDVLNAFDCLTSGPIPKKPLEILSSIEFAEMLEKLRQHYDKIIIDSPPVHLVSDALVLSKLSDSVVYVVKPHFTSIKLINSCLSRLTDAGAAVSGVFLSQVDIDHSKSYGGFELYGFGVDYQGYENYYGPARSNKMSPTSALGSEFTKLRNRIQLKKSA